MDTIVRVGLTAAVGILLLFANLSFIQLLRGSSEVVIAPFQVVGEKDDKLGQSLAELLSVQLQLQSNELNAWQDSITADLGESPRPNAPLWGLSQFWSQKTVTLDTRLLDETKFDVSVAGVQVGGALEWLQRRLVKRRTVRFVADLSENKSTIAGDLDEIVSDHKAVLIRVAGRKPEEITSAVAYAILQARLSRGSNNRLDALSAEEFRSLISILSSVARLNRNVALGRPAKDDFAALMPEAEHLTTIAPDWFELTYLAASIADSGGDSDHAAKLYEQAERVAPRSISDGTRDKIKARIAELRTSLASTRGPALVDAAAAIRSDAQYAIDVLGAVLGIKMDLPPVQLLASEQRNAYVETDPPPTTYHAAPQVKFLPDVTYHEMGMAVLAKAFPKAYSSPHIEGAAIAMSFSDICAAVVKQRRNGDTAQTADWGLAPGAVAWLEGDDVNLSRDRRPLRSLSNPGSAYSDEKLGTDKTFADYTKLDSRNVYTSEPHAASGIASKAFHDLAVGIGTDQAFGIWATAMRELEKKGLYDFRAFANATVGAAKNDTERIAVRAAWKVVNVPIS